MSNKIELSENTFTPLKEGKYVFTIEEIVYKAVFKRVEMRLATETGRKLYQNFYFMTKDNSPNTAALDQFSRMAKACLNDKNAKSVDPDVLKGKQFKAEVTHVVLPKKDNPAENVTFTNLKSFEPVDTKPAISDDELMALLG